MNQYYFLYKRIGKKQTLNLWAIVEGADLEKSIDEGSRTYFIGDFKYEFIECIHMELTL